MSGVLSAQRSVSSAAFRDAVNHKKSTHIVDSVGRLLNASPEACVAASSSATWAETLKTDIQQLPIRSYAATANGRMNLIHTHPADISGGNIPVSARRAQLVVSASRSGIDLRDYTVRPRPTVQQQSFYYPQCYQHSADATTACAYGEVPPTMWNALNQSCYAEQLVGYHADVDGINGHARPASFWSTDSPALQPTYQLMADSTYSSFTASPSFDNSGKSDPLSTPGWSESEMMTSNWLITTHNSASLRSVDRCRPDYHH